jgi:hypothetical protein
MFHISFIELALQHFQRADRRDAGFRPVSAPICGQHVGFGRVFSAAIGHCHRSQPAQESAFTDHRPPPTGLGQSAVIFCPSTSALLSLRRRKAMGASRGQHPEGRSATRGSPDKLLRVGPNGNSCARRSCTRCRAAKRAEAWRRRRAAGPEDDPDARADGPRPRDARAVRPTACGRGSRRQGARDS